MGSQQSTKQEKYTTTFLSSKSHRRAHKKSVRRARRARSISIGSVSGPFIMTTKGWRVRRTAKKRANMRRKVSPRKKVLKSERFTKMSPNYYKNKYV